MPRLEIFKQIESIEESSEDEEMDDNSEILQAFKANMKMLKLGSLPDLSIQVAQVGKSKLDETQSVLNTTQDSSVSSDSGSKKGSA